MVLTYVKALKNNGLCNLHNPLFLGRKIIFYIPYLVETLAATLLLRALFSGVSFGATACSEP